MVRIMENQTERRNANWNGAGTHGVDTRTPA